MPMDLIFCVPAFVLSDVRPFLPDHVSIQKTSDVADPFFSIVYDRLNLRPYEKRADMETTPTGLTIFLVDLLQKAQDDCIYSQQKSADRVLTGSFCRPF